jgi:hypothetical protein
VPSRLHDPVEETHRRLTGASPSTGETVATPGITSEDRFEELCSSDYRTIHPCRALEVLGHVSVDPTTTCSEPVDGRLELVRLRTTEARAFRSLAG